MKKNDDYSAFMGMGHNRPDDMSEVARLAEETYEAQKKVEKIQEELDAAKLVLRNYSEKLLPEKMEELGLNTYETTTGIHVRVKEEIRGGLPSENRVKGHEWLEKNGYGGIIKSRVVVPFKRDELTKANEFVEKLQSENMIAGLEREVHAQTLLAFIKEQLAQGNDIPLDIFKVYRQRVAKVDA